VPGTARAPAGRRPRALAHAPSRRELAPAPAPTRARSSCWPPPPRALLLAVAPAPKLLLAAAPRAPPLGFVVSTLARAGVWTLEHGVAAWTNDWIERGRVRAPVGCACAVGDRVWPNKVSTFNHSPIKRLMVIISDQTSCICTPSKKLPEIKVGRAPHLALPRPPPVL
jgi:hypothetical protein